MYDDANNNGTDNVTEYLPGNTMTVQNGTTYGNALDAQGNVLFSTQENVSASMSRSSENVYDAYGNRTGGGTTGSAKNYRGEYYDSETGLYYLNARYYDPTTQQFTQEDTYWGDVKDPGSLNLYGYCEGNPVMSSDPTGHKTVYVPQYIYDNDLSNADMVYWSMYGTDCQVKGTTDSSMYYKLVDDDRDNNSAGSGGGSAAASQSGDGSGGNAADNPSLAAAEQEAATSPDAVADYGARAGKATMKVIASNIYRSPISNSSSRVEFYKKFIDVANKADRYSQAAETIDKIGTKVGVAGAVAAGGVKIAGDLMNSKYSDSQKEKAVEIDAIQTAASVGVVIACAAIPGAGWGVLIGLGESLAAGTLINYGADAWRKSSGL